MKRFFKHLVVVILFINFYSLSISITKANTLNVVTKTSDKLLGNFIESAYNIFYSKHSDLDGFTYWYDLLSNGSITVKDFVENFIINSPDFSTNIKLKDDFLDKLYMLIFDRKIDKNAKKYWLKYIDSKILEYYRYEFPNSYTDQEILTLKWDINKSPMVIYDIVDNLISSGEFSIRSSFMNVKINQDDIILKSKRSDALEIYKFLNSDIYEINDQEVVNKKIQNAIRSSEKLQRNIQKKETLIGLKNKILNYLGDRVNNVAVSFYDINTRESFDINGDVLFKAGSTYKVPLNIVLYDLVQAGRIDLNEKVEYIHEKHYEGGAGVLQNSIYNKTLPPKDFKELSKRSLLNSDNIAANMLRSGISKYANLYKEYGNILGYQLNRTGNTFSTNEMNIFLKKLYYNKDNNPYYDTIIKYLKDSSTGVRIGRYIPDSIVANKFGAYDGNYHDVAIVYGDRPFILSIYTKNISNQDKVISDIARIVYER